jgi:hypothetical protein
MRRIVLKVVRKAYGSSLLGWMVAGIDMAGITGKYNNEEGTANLDSRVLCIGPEAVFGEGVYTRGGLFISVWEGFIRGA